MPYLLVGLRLLVAVKTRSRIVALSLLLAAAGTLIGGSPAQARDDLVCEKWGDDRVSTINDPFYGEVTVVQATCDLWGWAGKGPTDPTDPTPPKEPIGPGRDGPETPEPCSDVEGQTRAVQERLAADRQEYAAGSVTVAAEQGQVWVLTQLLARAQSDADVAVARRAAAEAAYVKELGLEDVLFDNGHGAIIRHPVTVTRASVDRSAKTAPALLAAMNAEGSALLDLHQAQLEHDAAAKALSADEEALRALDDEIAALTATLEALRKAAGTCTP